MKMNTLKVKRGEQRFTLIELFIALSVLLLLAGVIGWHVRGAIQHHHFQNSVDRFAVQLREMQALALSYQSDMEVEFSQKDAKISYCRKAEEQTTIFDRAKVSLKGVTSVLFNEKKDEKLKLTILSTGRVDPPGILHFKQGENSLWVDFSKPLLVKVTKEPPKK